MHVLKYGSGQCVLCPCLADRVCIAEVSTGDNVSVSDQQDFKSCLRNALSLCTMHQLAYAVLSKLRGDCRCYEIKCSTGVVTGNYSSSGASIPYNTSVGFQAAVNLDTVKDDYNRSWSGNSLKPQDELFTRCWNFSQVGAAVGRRGIGNGWHATACLTMLQHLCCLPVNHQLHVKPAQGLHVARVLVNSSSVHPLQSISATYPIVCVCRL